MSATSCQDYKYMKCIKCSECRFWNDLSGTLMDTGFCHNGEVAEAGKMMYAWMGCVYGIKLGDKKELESN